MRRRRFLIRRAAPVLLVLILGTFLWMLWRSASVPGGNLAQRALDNRIDGRTMQAIYQLELLAQRDGWTPALHVYAGDLWFYAGDLVRAADHWRLANLTNDSTVLRRLAQAYIDLQRWTEAVDALQQLRAAAPDDLWSRYQLGLIRASLNPVAATADLRAVASHPSYGAAADAVLTVITSNPNDELLPLRVGLALTEMQMWAYAEIAFEQSLFVGGAEAETLAYLGFVREQQNKDGSVSLERARQLAPSSPQVLYLYALYLRGRGDEQGSLDVIIQAITFDPNNPALYAELGLAYQLVGNPSEAEHWLQIAVEFSNNDPRFQRLLVQFYAEEAFSLSNNGIEALQQAAQEMPNDPNVRASIGWALYAQGDTAGALLELDLALRLDPNNSRALFYKGRILLEMGDAQTALDLLGRAVQLGGEFADEAARVIEGYQANAGNTASVPTAAP